MEWVKLMPVSLADLLEELGLVWQRLARCQATSTGARYDNLEPEKSRSEALRSAREAAQKPKGTACGDHFHVNEPCEHCCGTGTKVAGEPPFKEGDEAWARVRRVDGDVWHVRQNPLYKGVDAQITIHPDDIKRDE